MRVLFVTNPGEGQLYPMVPSAWALHASGHEVLVAAPENFLSKVTAVGLPAAASSKALNLVEIMTTGSGGSLRPTELTWTDQVRAAARGFAIVAERTIDGMSALIRDWRPDLVIAESTAFGAPVAAGRNGVPWAEHRPGPAMPVQLGQFVAEELPKEFELPEPVLIIDNCPPSFQHDDVPSGHVIRYVPYNGPGVLTDWMLARGDRKRVCVTLGTGLPHDPNSWSLLELIVGTLDGLGVELVLAVPDKEEVGAPRWTSLPGSVRGVGRFPLSAVLPSCDLSVNHGGAGSTMTSLVNGVPQLLLPHYGDQFRSAQRVSQRGVGLAVPISDVSPEAIKSAASALLDSEEYRTAAREVAGENASQQSPAGLVDVLLDVAGK